MIKTATISLIATSGIILQTLLDIHGWIFYLLFTAYLLLVKQNTDILKLTYTFLLGLLLSIGIWQLTGYLLVPFNTLKIAMPIAAFTGIFLVLILKKIPFFSMSPAFFFGLIAYYGLALPPSLHTLTQILVPAGAGILFGYVAGVTEKLNLFSKQLNN
jgi:hypothetical protein